MTVSMQSYKSRGLQKKKLISSTAIFMPPFELLLQKCSSVFSLRAVRQLHALLLTSAAYCPRSPYVPNNLISLYARCGSLGDAHNVFDEMPQRNLVSFNSLIAAYSRAPHHASSSSALSLYARFESECLRPNGFTFTSLLQASSLAGDWLVGTMLHAQVIKFGFLFNTRVQTSLLRVYSDCGDMVSVEKVFDGIVDKDVVSWNSMILENLKNDRIQKGMHLFRRMVRNWVNPTQFTLSMVLNACSRLGYYAYGKLIHARMIVSSRAPDFPLLNALLDMYCNCGDTQAALSIFGRMEKWDLVSWNTMIAGISENGDGETAMDLFFQLRRISFPKPDEYTFASIISAAGTLPSFEYGRLLHTQIIKVGFTWSVFIGSALVSIYFKNGDTESAHKVFYSIPDKDVVLWTEMIMCSSRYTDGESAMKFFCEMCRENHKIDSFALSGALSACADYTTLKQGEMIHSKAVKSGNDIEMSVCGSLIDMYAKNGNLQAAWLIFSRTSNPDLRCWNSMIGGYSHHGMAEEALKLFYGILNQGLKPDEVTFLCMLSGCNHSGLVDIGKFLWNYMKENGLVPGPKHYSCIVSLLSSSGLLDEAREMIIGSPLSADHLELWRTLLSSCVVNRNLAIGVYAAEQVLKLDAEDSATYIMLSNLYAASGRWDGVDEMRKTMRGLMLVKDPGSSWIEAN